MNVRRIRPVRLVAESAGEHIFTTHGRPKDERPPVSWGNVLMRLLTLGWGGAIMVALLDEFGAHAHLPFVLAMAMTALLVASAFMLTRPEAEERSARGRDDEADPEHDLLTELPTFNQFSRRLSDEFSRARKVGRQVAVVLIDVNNLSAVNKEYGVRAGDEVLRHVARAIDGTRRYSDVVARLGDDEFGVVLMDTAEDGVRAFIGRLEDRLSRESAVADVAGRSISLWAGICSGNAVSDPTMMRSETVLQAAMADLDRAKQERERRRRTWLSA